MAAILENYLAEGRRGLEAVAEPTGVEFGAQVSRALGFTGGSLALLVLFGIGISLMSGVSWLRAFEVGNEVADVVERVGRQRDEQPADALDDRDLRALDRRPPRRQPRRLGVQRPGALPAAA